MAKEEITDLVRVTPKDPNINIRLTLPVPPSMNKMYYNVRGGGRRLTAIAQTYIRTATANLNQQIKDAKWKKPHEKTWLYCDLVFYFPDRRIRDSHNCLKILMDVLQGTVYHNDYVVMPRIQSVEYDPINPRVEIRIFHQKESMREEYREQTVLT